MIPERLRGLVPHLPRDLETIVHKAIDRDPARRYPTAAALAEDLQRFLEDKPIKARRVTAVEQAWRWARRNPAVASLAAGLLLALLAGLVAACPGSGGRRRPTWPRPGRPTAKLRHGSTWRWRPSSAFTTGASEDVILKEKALEGLRKKLLGQSQQFYEKLRTSLEDETDRASRSALAEAVLDAGILYAKVDAPDKAVRSLREALRPAPPWRGSSRAIPPRGGTWAVAVWPSRSSSTPSLESTRPGPNWTRRGRSSRRWPGKIPQTAASGGWRPSVIRSTVGCSIDPATPTRGYPCSNGRGCSART